MEITEKLNVEARLAELERFQEYMLEEVLPKINHNNHTMEEAVESFSTSIVSTAMLLQNVAIQTLGKEDYEALLNDEAFTQEVTEALELFHVELKERINRKLMSTKFSEVIGALLEGGGLGGGGHDPSPEMCAKCPDEDCDHREAEYQGEE